MRGRAPLCQMAVLELLAERYGWTMDEIKRIPISEMEALMRIIRVKDKIREVDQKSKPVSKR